MKKLRWIKDYHQEGKRVAKKGELFNAGDKSASNFISQGYAVEVKDKPIKPKIIPLTAIQELILLKEDKEAFEKKVYEIAEKYQTKYVKIMAEYGKFIKVKPNPKLQPPSKSEPLKPIPQKKLNQCIIIPQKLQDQMLRFCRVQRGKKKPFEKDWPNKPYTYQDIQQYLGNENYGVLCGYGNLSVIDCDKDELVEVVKDKFPKTFTVKTGGGGMHFYYFIPGLEKKIILEKGKGHENHYGEVQSKGTQVVGPGSIHPNSEYYSVIDNSPIETLTREELYSKLKDYINDIQESEKAAEDERNSYTDIDSLSITDIWSTAGMKKQGDEYYGAHPTHGSTGGMNFWINPLKNTWHCFRCNSGGGPLSAIAVQHGLIGCQEARAGSLRGAKAIDALKIAQDKYGLQVNFEKSSNFVLLKKFSPKPFADEIMMVEKFVRDKFKRFWRYNYKKKVWTDDAEEYLRNVLRLKIFSDEMQQKKYVEEVVSYIRDVCWTDEDVKSLPLHLIPFKNKIYDLKSDKFIEYSNEYFVTAKLPIELDENEKDYSKIDKFLEEIVQDKKHTLYELMAYCLYRDYPYQKFFILYGSGQNGKSAFLKLLTNTLGFDNLSCIKPQDLVGDRFASVELFSKLANISPDIPYKEMDDSSLIREITGEDLIRGQEKHKSSFKFKNHAKLIFSANELPQVKDQNYAFDRRVYIIMFNTFIKNPNPNIINEISTREQLSGLGWYLISILKDLKKRGFSFKDNPDQSVMSKLYKELSNSLAKFLKEHTVSDYHGAIADWRLKERFKSYCEEKGFRNWKVTEINDYLRNCYSETNIPERFYDKHIGGWKDTRVRAWRGLKWKEDSTDKECQ